MAQVTYKPTLIRTYNRVLTAFRDEWEGFKEEPDDKQKKLIALMREARRKYRHHKDYEGATSHETVAHFTHRELEIMFGFGRGGFNEINGRLRLFHILARGSKARHVTNAYQLDIEAYNIYQRAIKKRTKRLQITYDLTGNIIRKLRPVLHSKNTKDRTAIFWKDVKNIIPHVVPVNLEELNQLENDYELKLETGDLFISENNKGKLKDRIERICLIRGAATRQVTGWGNVEHNYTEAKTGRLSAQGEDNLQSTPRHIRKAALVGKWDYDFENCHYAILQQMAKRYGMDCPHIKHYLENKKETRKLLMDYVDANKKQIKNSLLAIIYGARRTESPRAALYKTFDKDIPKIRKLIRHEIYDNLWNDVKAARDVILKKEPLIWSTWNKNLCGLNIKEIEKPAKRMAHLLQGAEAYMLKIALQLFHEDIILLVHDGFVCNKRLNKDQLILLSNTIKEETGFEMGIEETQLSTDTEEHDLGLSGGDG